MSSPQKQPPIARSRRNELGQVSKHRTGHDREHSTSTKSQRKKSSDGDSNNRSSVKILTVSNRSMAKWTPICEQAKSLLLESISHSSSLMTGNRKGTEEQIGRVIRRVKKGLATAAAPTIWRLKTYSNLNSKKVAMESTLSGLVRHNSDIDRRLERLKSQAMDQRSKVKQTDSDLPNSTTSMTTRNQHSEIWSSASEDVFGDYLKDLAEKSRHSIR